MEKQAVKFVATKLMKLVPVLNVISTIVDVAELIMLIKKLSDGEYGGAGGDGEKADKQSEPAPETASGERTAGDRESAGGTAEPKSKEVQSSVDAARRSLTPAAATVLGSVTRVNVQGPELDADQITLVGLMVPADLTPDEVQEVVAALRGEGDRASTAEDVIVAIDQAVRDVRNRQRSIKVNGKLRPDLLNAPRDPGAGEGQSEASSHAPTDGPITTPGQVDGEGPIVSPGQLEDRSPANESGGAGPAPAGAKQPLTTLAIVRGLPERVVGGWFQARGDELVLSAAGAEWRSTHVGAEIAEGIVLNALVPEISRGDRHWHLVVRFYLLTQGRTKIITHDFFVAPEGNGGSGARVNGLIFESVVMLRASDF